MKTQHKKPATGAKKGARTLAYPVEFRLRIVKLFLEEDTALVCCASSLVSALIRFIVG